MRRGGWQARMAIGFGVATLVTAAARGAAAQPRTGPGAGYRYTVEGYLAQYSLDDRIGTDKQALGAFGARVMFVRPDPDRASRSMVDRAVGGVFATFSPNQGTPAINTLHIGVETDIPFVARPIGGHLDPFFGFGIGAFRTSRPNALAGGPKRITRTDLAFTPALGTRIPFFSGIGARGDVRMPLVFGMSTTANFVAEGGLYVSF